MLEIANLFLSHFLIFESSMEISAAQTFHIYFSFRSTIPILFLYGEILYVVGVKMLKVVGSIFCRV